MIKVDFIGLMLSNPNHKELLDLIRKQYFEYINIPKCTEQGLLMGVELEAHVTLAYNKTFTKGPNWYYWLTTVKLRDLYKKISTAGKLVIPEVVIDTFDNEDSRVLKINVSNCNIMDVMRSYFEQIDETASERSVHQHYDPHITLTYLNPNTPDSVIEDLKSKVILSNYKEWDITHLQISGEKTYKFEI